MALAGLMVLAGCSPLMVDVRVLAGDAMGGRDNETEGSARARRYLIDRLDDFAVGVDASAPGDAAFTPPGPTVAFNTFRGDLAGPSVDRPVEEANAAKTAGIVYPKREW